MTEEALPVLLLSREMYTRGRCLYTRRLATKLPGQGFRPELVASRICPLSRAALPRNGVHELPTLQVPVLDWWAWGHLAQTCRDWGIKLVHAQSRVDWPAAERLANRLGVPVVLTIHDFLGPRETLRFRPRCGGRIIAVSPSVKADLVQRTGIDPELVRVIPIGIDLKTEPPVRVLVESPQIAACTAASNGGWAPLPPAAPAPQTGGGSSISWHPEHHQPAPPRGPLVPVIGTVGALEPIKGQEVFLRAAKEVLSRGIKAEFLIYGQGPDEARLRRLAGELGLLGAVTFVTSPVPLDTVLSAIGIFCLPSLQQGLGSIMFEAMALGKPVIASSVGGAGEVFTHGVSGLYVPPGTADGWADAMIDLLQHPDKARRLGEAGREVIERDYALDGMIQQTVQVYRKLLQRKAPAKAAA